MSHITINGKPLCQCEGHAGGVLGELFPFEGRRARITCGYSRVDRARAAAIYLTREGKNVKLVVGDCPAFITLANNHT